ncbi:Bromodomain-containing protein [Lactarius hengduanensis]|nr:Bromodomain-containing protein [Lactarius hengduanensis]
MTVSPLGHSLGKKTLWMLKWNKVMACKRHLRSQSSHVAITSGKFQKLQVYFQILSGTKKKFARIRSPSTKTSQVCMLLTLSFGPFHSVTGPVRRRGRPPAADSQTSKKFQTVIIMVHSQISQHRNGNIFHNPIKKSEAPDYYDIVKRPMDLKTIKARIREGQIASSAEFQRDVYLMFANSLMYNRPGSDIYTMAEEMMLESEAQINTFRQTEGIIKGSHR